MAIDGIFLHFIKNEISDFALGARVDKIYFPSRYELVLVLRTRTQAKKLFISVGGNSPRINFTAYSPENPSKPPMLCMLFRKQLSGALITDIRQSGLDRVLFIDFNATDEIGNRVKRTLVIEIMAQYSNCILLNENGVIIDSLKRVDSSKSSFREILPSLEYKLPPGQNKLDIRFVSASEAVEKILSAGEKTLSSAVLSALSGVSPLTAKEIAYRVTLGDENVNTLPPMAKERLLYEIDELKNAVVSGKCSPCFLTDENGRYLEFSFFPLTLYSNAAAINKTQTLSELLDVFCFEKEIAQRAKSKAEDLFKCVANLIERTAKKINIQHEELLSCDDMETKRVFAELINANIYALAKGKSVYEIENYYDGGKITAIPVKPQLTPSQNAQRYYKEYRKAQTAKKILTEQIEKNTADLEYLKSVQDELVRAQSEKELAEIRAELSSSGFLKSKTGTKNKKNAPLPPLSFVAPDGFTVLVGRNNIQNDELSFKKAKKDDLWFHVQKAHGSHVILQLEGRKASDVAMEFAAKTAAYYSSVRERGTAEVDYTAVQNLKKPPAARPGYVIYHIYNTVYAKAENPAQGQNQDK